MHRVATEPGHLDQTQPSTRIEQTSAELIFISAADSDLSLVAQAWLPIFGNRLRFVHASALQHPETVEHYAHEVLCHSRLIVLRLLGGASYFPHLMDELQHLRQHPERNFRILLLPGTEQWDESVCDYNDFSESFAQNCFTYLREGGVFNAEQLGRLLLRELGDATHFEVEAPQVM
ncbi:MAG: cobaltochelatase subunit CobN, partial [SAR324 cluster bacterium]|nr:cobaltochelatase subunit CobN [SAR324 cluster bacterium]